MTNAELVEKIGQARAADFRESSRRGVAAAFAAPTIMVLEAAARAGFALVPLEATEEMIEPLARAMAKIDGQNPDGVYKAAGARLPAWMGYRDSARAMYAASIAARPGWEKDGQSDV